jgi:hypothetical protein
MAANQYLLSAIMDNMFGLRKRVVPGKFQLMVKKGGIHGSKNDPVG